jgi:predicted NBD/HSP70 family sugar kinase/predicted transcriptional regulator
MGHKRIQQVMADKSIGLPASRIIRTLGQNGGMTAAQIARHTGLARSTVSTAVSDLKQSRVVVELDQRMPKKNLVGRPGTLLTLNPNAGTCLGIHLGYDEVQIVVADISHSFIAEQSARLGVDYAPRDALTFVKKSLEDFYRTDGFAISKLIGVGVSVSGPVKPDGVLLRGGILPSWAGVNIIELFATIFKRPILVDNESNCAAVAEMKWGAARNRSDFVLFKMDVGVGGAIVTNGRVVKGVSGGAGEFGHVSADPNGELCRCGNRGCLELYASFAGPLRQLSRIHNRDVSMDDAIKLAEAGDAAALRMIAEVGEYGGRGLAMIGTMLNPPLIIIGGRMALAGDLLLRPMRDAHERRTLLKPQELEEPARTLIQIGKFTENDSLLGAVGLVLDHGLIKA